MTKSTKTILWIVGVVIVVVVIIAATRGTSTNTGPIKIGATLSLTGNLAYIGTSEQNGLILASEEINSKGGISGHKIEIIAEDNAGDAKTAVSSAQKLLSVDKVNLLFSAFTGITKAVAPVAVTNNVPLIYAASDGTIAADNNLVFRDYWDVEQSATALFKKIQADGIKSVKIIAENQDACLLFTNTFKKEAATTDIKITGEAVFPSTEKDYRTYLTKFNLKSGDAVYACAYRSSQILIKNMSDLGLINIPTYQLVAPFLPVANEPGARELFTKNKTVSTWYGFGETGNTQIQNEFIKNYKARFNTDPIADSAYTYDDVYILAGILGKCYSNGSIDNGCFKSEMSKVNYSGVGGRLSFDEKGRSNRDVLLIQAQDNQWKTIQ